MTIPNLNNNVPDPPDIFGNEATQRQRRRQSNLPSVSLKAALVIGTITFLFGSCLGRANSPVVYKTRTVPGPTVTVTKKVTETKVSYPEPCVEAMEAMSKLANSVDPILNAQRQQVDIMSDAHVALATQDYNKLNSVVERQQKLDQQIVGAEQETLLHRQTVNKYLPECKTALGR